MTGRFDAGGGFSPARRRVVAGIGAFAAGAAATRLFGGDVAAAGRPAARPDGAADLEVVLEAAERPLALPCFGGRPLPLWTFSDRDWLPVLRIRRGGRLRARLANRLPPAGEHTSIHWHGIRLPNGQDGVPYLTQEPVAPGEDHIYDFTVPDAGSFFFHTHCNTAEQLGRGLAGILLVEGDESEPFDAERLVVLRDWSVGADGRLGPFLSGEAARAGTFGDIRSCNGMANPVIEVPAVADVRLRIFNVDRTRIMQLGIEGAECAVVAIDGMPVPPFPLKAWFAGPAMRVDVVMRSPGHAGEAVLYDYFAPQPVPLARLRAHGKPLRLRDFDPAPLRPAGLAEPDLQAAERLPFAFTASASAPLPAAESVPAIFLDDLCATPATHWAINRRAWPGRDHSRLPPPLAVLRRGRSYVFELRNQTSHMHPIHIHGHSFRWLRSSRRELPGHLADTVLLQPKERVEVAFVADNPGDWMFHCHIIEHQETGMMGYVRVA